LLTSEVGIPLIYRLSTLCNVKAGHISKAYYGG